VAAALGGASVTAPTEITGPSFGIDFSPSVDRLRVLTSAGQNFRIDPNTGLVMDADVNEANGTTQDPALNGGTTNAAADGAYTNNQSANGGVTTLYTIADNSLFIQSVPNSGKLISGKPLANVESVFGFDIPPGVNAQFSDQAVTAGSGTALVKLKNNAATQLASIDLTNGNVGVVGALPFNDATSFTLAASPRPIMGLSSDGTKLLRFDEVTVFPTSVTLSGIGASEALVALAFRPSTGQLYALGVNVGAKNATLYLVDPQSAQLKVVGGPGTVAFFDGGAVTLPVATSRWGMHFNPTTDTIHVVTTTGLNFRIKPDGTPVDSDPVKPGANPDPALSGGATALNAVAYTNGVSAGGVTTAYGINAANRSLHVIANPGNGVVGPAIPIDSAYSEFHGFDIPQAVTAPASGAPVTQGYGYLAVEAGGGIDFLLKIDLLTGKTTTAGVGQATRSIAVGR